MVGRVARATYGTTHRPVRRRPITYAARPCKRRPSALGQLPGSPDADGPMCTLVVAVHRCPAAGWCRRSTRPRCAHMPGKVLPESLRRIAAEQSSVVSHMQLRAHGVTSGQVRHAVLAGRWQAYGPKAVLLHNAGPTWEQRAWAAVINTGSTGGVLGGTTAATLQGLTGWSTDQIHLLVAKNTRGSRQPGVVVHSTRRDLPRHQARALPMTPLERSIVDGALWAPRLRAGCGLLAAAVQQGLTVAERLRRELLAAIRAPNRSLLLQILDDIAGGSRSLAEIDFVRLSRAAGLPAPLRQSVRLDSFGRRRYLDTEYPFRSGRGTFDVEVDGALICCRRRTGTTCPAAMSSPLPAFPRCASRPSPCGWSRRRAWVRSGACTSLGERGGRLSAAGESAAPRDADSRCVPLLPRASGADYAVRVTQGAHPDADAIHGPLRCVLGPRSRGGTRRSPEGAR